MKQFYRICLTFLAVILASYFLVGCSNDNPLQKAKKAGASLCKFEMLGLAFMPLILDVIGLRK